MDELRIPEWHLIDRYMAGDASEHERAQVERWLAHGMSRRDVLADVARMGDDRSVIEPAIDVAADWKSLAAKMDDKPSQIQKNTRHVWQYLSVAAAVVIAVFSIKYLSGETPTVGNYTTTNGQRAAITLSDGSTITLAPGSKLTSSINKTSREINLTGQAIFTVNQDKSRPFTVTTRGITTKVLGTTFGIRAYDNDESVRVSVSDGKVSVQQAIVTAGSMATVSGDNVARVTAGDSALISWRNGAMVFDKEPVRNVLADLSRWYDADFVVTDETISSKRLTASFEGQTLTTAVVERIATALGTSYSWHGRTITFTPIQ